MLMPVARALALLPAWSVQVPVAVWSQPVLLSVTVTVGVTGPERASVQAKVAVTGWLASVPARYGWPSAVLKPVRATDSGVRSTLKPVDFTPSLLPAASTLA